MPALTNFMESLTREQDKLVKMGTMKSTRDQALVAGVSNQYKGKKKYLKQREKEKKHSDTESSSSTDRSSRYRRRKNKREIHTCGY